MHPEKGSGLVPQVNYLHNYGAYRRNFGKLPKGTPFNSPARLKSRIDPTLRNRSFHSRRIGNSVANGYKTQAVSVRTSSGSEVDCPTRRRLPQLLRRAWYGLNQAFRRRIAHTGVTPDQFTVMRTLLEGDAAGLTQRDLTTAMSSDPNTVASLLERMAVAGWIERQPHESDRRAYRIRLLPTGRASYDECRALAVELQAEVLAVLPEGEREHFLVQLDQLARACRGAAENSPRPGTHL